MGDHHHHPAAAGTAELAELLDLDAEVLHAHLAEVTDWVRELTAERPPRRILDLGCGTGTGTFALLRRFPDADATAVDVSPEMLQHLGERARALGVAERVHTVAADLDATWPALDPVDLVWASASLHHMADPDRALAEAHRALRPGGLLAVVELDSFPRFLPDDFGYGLEERCHAALADDHAERVPHLGTDWGPALDRAGFTVEANKTFAIDLRPPLPASAGRYAQASLRRIRGSLEGRLSADDLATLDALLDSPGPDGVAARTDLRVRTTRTVWMAGTPRP